MVPRDHGKPGAVRTRARCDREIRAVDENFGFRLPVGGQAHDLVAHIDRTPSAGRMALPDRHEGAVRTECAVGVTIPARHGGCAGERDRCTPGLDPVQPLIGPVDEIQHPVAHPPCGATVFVHRSTRVHPLRQQVGTGSVGSAAHDLGPASFGRTAFRPVHVDPVHPHLTETHRGADDMCGGGGSRPGPEG